MRVIACPRCIRTYEVPHDMAGKLARCDACKVYFTISVAEWVPPGEAVTLDRPLAPFLCYMYEAAHHLAANARELFGLANESFTPANLARFVSSLDLEGGNPLIRRAHERCSRAELVRVVELADYFNRHIPGQRPEARRMLLDAFAGVLSAEFDKLGGLQVYRPWWRFWR